MKVNEILLFGVEYCVGMKKDTAQRYIVCQFCVILRLSLRTKKLLL